MHDFEIAEDIMIALYGAKPADNPALGAYPSVLRNPTRLYQVADRLREETADMQDALDEAR